jgi:hypothetical protein
VIPSHSTVVHLQLGISYGEGLNNASILNISPQRLTVSSRHARGCDVIVEMSS